MCNLRQSLPTELPLILLTSDSPTGIPLSYILLGNLELDEALPFDKSLQIVSRLDSICQVPIEFCMRIPINSTLYRFPLQRPLIRVVESTNVVLAFVLRLLMGGKLE